MTDKPNDPTTKSAAAKAATSPAAATESLIAANQRGFKAAQEMQAHMLSRASTVNAEIMAFIERRLDANRKVAQAFAACKSPPEALAAYGDFVESALQQYSEEAGRLAGIYVDQAGETVEEAQRLVSDTVSQNGAAGGEKKSPTTK